MGFAKIAAALTVVVLAVAGMAAGAARGTYTAHALKPGYTSATLRFRMR